VTSPTKVRVGSKISPKTKNAVPTWVAVAISPRATSPPEIALRNIEALPVDSAIVEERAP
jgi:hypothetical protein